MEHHSFITGDWMLADEWVVIGAHKSGRLEVNLIKDVLATRLQTLDHLFQRAYPGLTAFAALQEMKDAA